MSHKKGQTIIELAVFGSILVFVLAMIIRQGLSFGYLQNQSLRAMRMALATSYMYSEGLKDMGPAAHRPGKGTAGRNRASIFILEDRLTTDATKYGSIERSPYMNAANATFSRLLFQPIDASYDPDEPVVLEPGVPFILPPDATEHEHLPKFDMFINGIHIPLSVSGFAQISRVDPLNPSQNIQYYYTIIPNSIQSGEWCYDNGVPCPCLRKPNFEDKDEFIDLDPELCEKFPVEKRFDLKRCSMDRINKDDCVSDPNKYKITDPKVQKDFFWQWDAIHVKDLKSGSQVDLDGDLKEESVVAINDKDNKIIYIDDQVGDVDFTIGDHEDVVKPGLLENMDIMTRTKDGTYLFINEGRLFDENNQFIRTASKKDSVDIVQRLFQLSRNTGRFCNEYNNPTDNDHIWTNDIPEKTNGKRNPVEACGGCMEQENLDKTCLEIDVDPPVLYIRSRILDMHGRNWVTGLTGVEGVPSDPSINFRGPDYEEEK